MYSSGSDLSIPIMAYSYIIPDKVVKKFQSGSKHPEMYPKGATGGPFQELFFTVSDLCNCYQWDLLTLDVKVIFSRPESVDKVFMTHRSVTWWSHSSVLAEETNERNGVCLDCEKCGECFL